jgi:hypothetical protein
MESDEPSNRDELIAELERLEREEAQLSAMRRRLHNQIDLGFPNETTFEREREVSDKRLELHGRIDALRDQLAPLTSQPKRAGG